MDGVPANSADGAARVARAAPGSAIGGIAAHLNPTVGMPVEVHDIPVDRLKPADSPRLTPVDEDHARALAATDAVLPPIEVHRSTMRVIDGVHRVRAATIRGATTISARFFDGSEHEAFVRGVQANTRHGKPLTLAEREAAAARILHGHPEWADRAVADACALSPKTVAAIRKRANVEFPQSHTRVGRDGRIRPLDSAPARQRAAELITANPEASLRRVANAAGVSPATVRDVRARMGRGASPVPKQAHRPAPKAASPPAEWGTAMVQQLRGDRAFLSTEPGMDFANWFEDHVVNRAEWERFVESIPKSRVYVVADLARGAAAAWTAFADALERRMRDR